MDKTTFDTVLGIATDVRYWVEGRAEGDSGFNGHDLNGYCAIASAELFRQLKKQGFKPEIHVWYDPSTGDAHAFVVVEDHVVDVTATQFRGFRDTSVVIKHVREAASFEYWNSSYSMDCADAFRKRQKKDRWPARQIAYAA